MTVFPGSSLAALLLASLPLAAQEPGQATVELADQTLFLATDLTLPGPALVTRDAARITARFAQLHLGFPTLPELALTLDREGDEWRLHALHLDRLGFTDDLHARPGELTLELLDQTETDLRLRLIGQMIPDTLGPPRAVRIDLRLPLPPLDAP